jgi:hypothetical protein
VPTDYITWSPSKELLAWVKSRQKLQSNDAFTAKQSNDPFVQEAKRVFPGLAPGDSFLVNDRKTRLSIKDAAAGIRALYLDMLNRSWSEARSRGEKLPPLSQKNILPSVPGQQ